MRHGAFTPRALACALLVCLLAAGCAAEGVATDRPYAGTTLIWTMIPANDSAETQLLIDLVYEETGIIVERRIVPESVDGELDRALIRLMAGDEVDIVYYASPRLKPLVNAGVLTPLDDIAASMGYDIQAIYGDYLPVFDGHTYGLPAFSDIWLTMYNKKVFDDAGVPYPSAEGWTWEKYIETAQQLTNVSKGVYGSLMLDYNCYNYMYAVQSGAEHYGADGLSNYADPRFAEGLAFFYDLGNTYKIQPSIREFSSGNVPWDAFFTQDAEYGMFVCGGWTLQMMAETQGSRDWQFGLLPMPYPEGQAPSTLTLPGSYAIPATSQKQEAAFAAIACMAENQYTLGYGRIPARRDLTDAEIHAYVERELSGAYAADGITAADIEAAWFDPGRLAYPEKVMGAADVRINDIWVEEGQAYGRGEMSLEEAMARIKRLADEAIEAEQ